ncbi:MAG TPA: glycosyltransferase [Stellaceae bacterium]|jgi:glycosyltransferase involved in cell wall biosynthesis|nr:glycosyltransferase [Stellaceae bacterium]
MAHIVMTDDGIAFDGMSPSRGPLGGAEAAFLTAAEALAARGHRVEVRNRCAAPMKHNGVDWESLASDVPEGCDLYVANRSNHLIGLAPHARRRAFWIHNPGRYLKKWRYVSALWRYRPVIITTGRYHESTVPRWMPSGGRVAIPYAIPDVYRRAPPLAVAPPPRAIFTSNPLRGLDWLFDQWETHIHPAVPQAELHLYCGPSVYGAVGEAKAAPMRALLSRADELAGKGVRLFAPLPRAELIEVLRQSRAMLYRGDENETFCMSVAEAQALGVPAVVQPLGSMHERVQDGVTGFVDDDAQSFAQHAIALLSDDALWRQQHEAALRLQKGLGADEVAQRFEALMS